MNWTDQFRPDDETSQEFPARRDPEPVPDFEAGPPTVKELLAQGPAGRLEVFQMRIGSVTAFWYLIAFCLTLVAATWFFAPMWLPKGPALHIVISLVAAFWFVMGSTSRQGNLTTLRSGYLAMYPTLMVISYFGWQALKHLDDFNNLDDAELFLYIGQAGLAWSILLGFMIIKTHQTVRLGQSLSDEGIDLTADPESIKPPEVDEDRWF